MAIKARCEQCGKSSVFSDRDAGLTALCSACGARFRVPDAASATARELTRAAEVKREEAQPGALPPSVPVPPPAPQDLPGGGRGAGGISQGPLLWGMFVAAAALLLTAGVAVYVSLQPTWEERNAESIRELAARGERLVQQRRLPEAYEAYRELSNLVDPHREEIRDPALRAEVDRARKAREQLFIVLLSRKPDQPVAAGGTGGAGGAASAGNAATPGPSAAADPATGGSTGSTGSPSGGAPSAAIASAAGAANTAGNDVPGHWEGYEPKPLKVTKPRPSPAEGTGEPRGGGNDTASRPPRPQPGGTGGERPGPGEAIRPARAFLTVRTPEQRGIAPPPVVRGPGGTTRPVRRSWPTPGQITDEEIGQAIQKAVNHLLGRFQDGRLQYGQNPRRGDAYYTGLNALCVYALLQSSYAIKDERLNLKGPIVKRMIDEMKKMPADEGHVTYARGIRASALALVNRPEDREALKADVAYLVNAQRGGAYTYAALPRRPGSPGDQDSGPWDNSNSQYGLLGVWAGAEVGMEINTAYWQAVERHWTMTQGTNGAWDYRTAGGRDVAGRLSMSVAGLASLFVTHDYLDAPKIGSTVGREPFSPALRRGLAHLEEGDRAINIDGGYTLYGLERVGLASGFKFIGDHDWYRVLARAVVDAQDGSGGWSERGGHMTTRDAETAFHLLFLARGRHPVMMNKLRYEGAWANRPRDVANLARFGSRELERQLNWQVVPIDRPWFDWMDSPILYISNHIAPNLNDEQVDKIRAFVQAGGMLFTQADGTAVAATAGFEKLARRLFPTYEMKDLPDDHEVFNVLFKPSPRPILRGVSNGVRLLMVHSPADVSQTWQMRQEKTRRSIFELGVNLFLYASGKADLRNRLASPYIPPQGDAAGGTVRVARVKYGGNWDPEPMAWTRFSRLFQYQTDVRLEPSTVRLEQLGGEVPLGGGGGGATGAVPDGGGSANGIALAHWTGAAAYTPTDAEIAALRKYVEAGGVLLVDAAGGNAEFADAVRLALLKAFPESRLAPIPRDHPLLSGQGIPAGDDVTAPLVRPYVKSRTVGLPGRPEWLAFGKGTVIFTPMDLTHALLGAGTWGVYGYAPEYAADLVQNILLWSATGRPGEGVAKSQ